MTTRRTRARGHGADAPKVGAQPAPGARPGRKQEAGQAPREEASRPRGGEPPRLPTSEVRRVARAVEARQRYRLGVTPTLTFATTKRFPKDYASWRGEPALRGTSTPAREGLRFRLLRVRLFSGMPLRLQRVALVHELTEAIQRLKGASTSKAHRAAMRAERAELRKLPDRTRAGKPYRRTLPLLRRLEAPTSQAPPAAPARWRRLARRVPRPFLGFLLLGRRRWW